MPAPTVKTKSGIVEGFRISSSKGGMSVFLGIPYAQPPINELRFQKTVPVAPWTGVRKCKRYQKRAPQNDLFWEYLSLRVGKSEDCLYLNIIAPDWEPPSEKGFPVLFYIHGGGFVVDSAVRYNYRKIARLLASQGVVVVTVQYRLGYLGFFTTEDGYFPGNYGIWDLVTAVNWVNENIQYFNGNPELITVAGQSAGAVAADLLTLTPYSRKVINQVILLGGNAECPWAVADNKRVADYCRKHVEKLGWRGDDNGKMLEFLRSQPAATLADGMIGNGTMFRTGLLPLAPVIDGDLLPKSVAELRDESPNVRALVGMTEDEGLLFVGMGRMACNQKDIEMGIRLIADATKGSNIDAREVVQQVYMKQPVNQQSDAKNPTQALMKRAFVDMLSDLTSNYGTGVYVEKLLAKSNPVYVFSLEHCNPACYGLLNIYLPYRTATHGTELIYLMDTNIYSFPFIKSRRDRHVTKLLTRSLINFAKHGDPNLSDENGRQYLDVQWEPAKPDANELHLRIADSVEMRDKFKNGRINELKTFFSGITLKF